METAHTETQGNASATTRSFDLDAMGLGPPTKVRRRGKVDDALPIDRKSVV